MSTKDLGPLQLELAGRLLFGDIRLYSFAPFITGMWLDAVGLGAVLALFGRWQVTVAATDKTSTRLLVVSSH